MVRPGASVAAVLVAVIALASTLTACHTIDTEAMPQLYLGLDVSIPMRSTGGAGPLTWSATGLPPGLSIDPATGVVSGRPTAVGPFQATVSAVDPASNGATQRRTYSGSVASYVAPPSLVSPTIDHAGAQISGDGRYLVDYLTDGSVFEPPLPDAFRLVLFDLATGVAVPVYVEDDGHYSPPAISSDGRWVAYVDTKVQPGVLITPPWHVYVWDRLTGHREEVPNRDGVLGSYGGALSLSSDGRFVGYEDSDATGDVGIYVYDRETGTTATVADGLDNGLWATIAADGSTVVFATTSPDLVAGDDNGRPDVFVWDRATRSTRRITDNRLGDAHAVTVPAISSDGTTVAYLLDSAGSWDLYLWDASSGATSRIARSVIGFRPALSDDGSTVLYQGDGGSTPAVGAGLRLWERATGATTHIRSLDHMLYDLDLSADGRRVVYEDRQPFGTGGLWIWDRLG